MARTRTDQIANPWNPVAIAEGKRGNFVIQQHRVTGHLRCNCVWWRFSKYPEGQPELRECKHTRNFKRLEAKEQ